MSRKLGLNAWRIFAHALICTLLIASLRQRNRGFAKQGTKIQPKVFLTEVFGNHLGSGTSAPSGHGCPRRNACFSTILTSLTEVLGRDIRASDPRMSAGCPSQKLPLWADFSFLTKGWFPKEGFWQTFPCTKFPPKVFPCSATPAEESNDFNIPGRLRNRIGTGNPNRRNRFSLNRKQNRNRQNRFPGTGTGTVFSC